MQNLKSITEHEKHLLSIKINGLINERNILTKSNEQNLVLYEELKKRY